MKIKKLNIISIILSFILAFPLHFLYDLVPCFFTSVISPVNESIWEHMKIIFGSILLSSIIIKIILNKKQIKKHNFWFANFISSISAIFLFLLIYLPIYYKIGEHLHLTLIIMLFIFIIVQYISITIMKTKNLHQEKLTIIYILLIYILFSYLTYFPPHTNLFLCPKNLIYGIKKN